MEIPIFCNGKEYISAIRAGEYVGYSSDYVGQLCRAGKISAKLVGRTWYVDLEELKNHRENRILGKPKKTLLVSDESGEIVDTSLIESDKRLVFTTDNPRSLHFKYDSDSTDLLPRLASKGKRPSMYLPIKSSTKSILLVPVVVLGLLVFVLLFMNSMVPGNVVKGSDVSSYAKTFYSVSNKTLSAAALLVGEIWSETQSIDSNGNIGVDGTTYKELLLADKNSLNREEIRLILLGDTQVENAITTSTSTSSPEEGLLENQVVPVENPFGIPQ